MKIPAVDGSRTGKCLSDAWIFVKEIAVHLWADLRGIDLSPWVYVLAFIHTAIFIWPIFLMNDVGLSFLSAVGVDHTSMLVSLITILEPTTFYNQMSAYHSSFYGWTYFFFSFWILLPVKLIAWSLGVKAFMPLYVGLKVLHFIYGLLATLSFFFLARKFVPPFCAAIGALTLTLGTALFQFEYMFHPEAVGVLFLNLGLIYLHDFCVKDAATAGARRISYYCTLLFLVMATLAKPSFFLIAGPLYLILLAAYIRKSEATIYAFLKQKGGIRLMESSLIFSIAVFFVVNPSFILKFRKAFQHQLDNAAFQTHSPLGLTSASASIAAWVHMLNDHPFTWFALGTTVIVTLYICLAKKLTPFARKSILFIELMVLLNFVFTICMYRMFIMSEYLIPIYPILILNSLVLIYGLLRFVKLSNFAIGVVALAIIAAFSFHEVRGNVDGMTGFYSYRSSPQYNVYDYIRHNLPDNVSIAHDQLIAIPDGKNITDYHFWQHPAEQIEAVHPDYIIYDTLNKFNGKYCEQTLTLMHMTETEPYKKIATLEKPGSSIQVWNRQ